MILHSYQMQVTNNSIGAGLFLQPRARMGPAMCLWYGWKYCTSFVGNLVRSPAMKEFLKLVKI